MRLHCLKCDRAMEVSGDSVPIAINTVNPWEKPDVPFLPCPFCLALSGCTYPLESVPRSSQSEPSFVGAP